MELNKLHNKYQKELTYRLLFIENKFKIYNDLLRLTQKRGIKVLFYSPDHAESIGANGYYSLGTIGLMESPLEIVIPIFAHELGHYMDRRRVNGIGGLVSVQTLAKLPPIIISPNTSYLDEPRGEVRAWKYAERLIALYIKKNGGM